VLFQSEAVGHAGWAMPGGNLLVYYLRRTVTRLRDAPSDAQQFTI
jgi:hypothetical protein